ncbi:hypothetical protein AB7M63_006500 [Bradyrhizobium japonicum]
MEEIEDYAQFLSEAAASEVAIVHEFRIQYAQDDNSIHVFFEGGEDRLFYLPHVRGRCGSSLHSYVCNGKPKLAQIRNEVTRLQFDARRYLFFVDRDYDDFLNCQITQDANTYITDNYSIENDLASFVALEILLADFAGISKSDSTFHRLMEAYASGRKDFADRMLPFAAWILAMRQQGQRPNLNNVNLGAIFEIASSDCRVRKKPGAFEVFRKSAGLAGTKVARNTMRQWITTLRPLEDKKWIRGKYDLWFFRNFLLCVITLMHKQRAVKWKVPKPLIEDRLFESLGGRIPVPVSLSQFLDTAFAG